MVLYARDIVESDFLTLSSLDSVLEGARAMKKARHGYAVVGSMEKPEGMVTEWDILSKVVAEGKDPAKISLGDIMSRELIFVDGGTGLSAVSQIMTEKGIRRLLVEEKGKVTGVITSKTMMARMSEYVDKVSTQISRLQAPGF